MLIKYCCGNCGKTQITASYRKQGETITKEFYSCTCHHCKFENEVLIFKPRQWELPFPEEKPNRPKEV